MKKRSWFVFLVVIPMLVLLVGTFVDAVRGLAPVLDISVLVGR